MAQDPIEQNIKGVKQLVSSGLNKLPLNATDDQEGPVGDYIDELSLELSDEQLELLADQITRKYKPYESQLTPRQDKNQIYYQGKQNSGSEFVSNGMPIAANLVFEAVETFIPAALAKNPEPVVYADNTEPGNKISSDVKTMLQYHADALCMRQKLGQTVRNWTTDFIGALKHGWDSELKEIKYEVIDSKKLIFDPESCVDAYGDSDSEIIGQSKTCTATELIAMFPKFELFISMSVENKLGTKVNYTEWWSDDYCFYTYMGKVLDKSKNPHFNYAEGKRNHFAKPKKPFTFLTVFSNGQQPHDITGLIEQNIPNQNRISKREIQIDRNLDNANNGLALSGDNFNQETGKQAANARQAGRPILVPAGRPISEAISTLPSAGVPDAFFKAADRDKQDLRSIFGTEGISSQPADENTTARGMILNQSFDNSRIGGGVGDRIEQVADNSFNWWTQLYYVYYDVKHFAAIMGQMKAVEFVTLQSEDMDRQLIVSVAADSMKPKDEITQMNQAMTLWESKAIDIKTLLTVLNFPDPQKTAAQAWLFQTNPQLYGQLNFPELQQEIQELLAAQMPQGVEAPPAPPPNPLAPPEGAPPGAEIIPPSPEPNISIPMAGASLSQVPLPQ